MSRTSHTRGVPLAMSLLILSLLVVAAPPAAADAFTVDSTGDTGDATPGDGVCDDGAGYCTLRAAVEEANALAGVDVVNVPAGTYVPASRISITSDVTIAGAGSASTRIHDSTNDYVFWLDTAGIDVTVTDLTLGQGDHTLPGHGILVARDDTTLTVERAVFDGLQNDTLIVAGPGYDPDPANVTVTVTDSTFQGGDYSILFAGDVDNPILHISGSTFDGNYYGILFDGVGGEMTLTDSLVTGTEGPSVEFYAIGASLSVVDSTIVDSYDTFGEGIYGGDDTATIELVSTDISGHPYQGLILSGDVTIVDSTVSGNGRDGLDHTDGDLLIEGSTFSGNVGAGIGAYRGGSSATIRNTTVAGNTDGTGLYVDDTYATVTIENVTVTGDDFGLGVYAPTYTIRNTIVAGAAVTACESPLTSAGHNLADDTSCGFTATGDLEGVDPKLGPLTDNGGPVPTRLPAADSPAVDAGDDAHCPATDQRGYARSFDGDGDGVASCDIGAVERGAAPVGTADLSLSMSADPGEVPVGALVTFDLAVANAGPDPAPGTTVTLELPTGLAFSAGPDGCVEDGSVVICPVGTVPAPTNGAAARQPAAAGTAGIEVVATATATGEVSVSASVSSPATDPDGSDNGAQATVTVVAPPETAQRLFGIDRIETAVSASQNTYEDGTAGAVVLARQDTFPDALSGAPLAVANQAPLLLTPTGELDDRTATELQRVLPSGGTVHLLGGLAALSQQVADAVEALGYVTVRYPGQDRYETAVLIAEALGDPEAIFVATGRNFPDALTAGAAAAELHGVILLTADDQMVASTQAYLTEHASVPRWAVGGPSAAADPDATGLVGSDRYATALLVATTFFEDPVVVGVAVGTKFPDALSGDTHIARRRAPMLLTAPTALPASVADYLMANRASITKVFLYGGPVAISDDVETAITAALQ